MGRLSCRAILLALALAACARAPVVISPIIDIPPYPALPECTLATGQGKIEGETVIFDFAVIEVFREGLKAERACYLEREALLDAWGQKLLNRLKAVTQP